MGPANACAYGDVVINKIDVEVNEGQNWPEKYRPLFWTRYRDDVLVLWQHGLEMLDRFLDFLNSLISGIIFTRVIQSSQGTAYLQTEVYIKDKILHTRPFSKPCDTHTYLIPSSCHATHNISNIPFCIAHTIYKIASEPAEYSKSKLIYTEHLKARGYR